MSRNEKLILVRDLPEAIISALDAVLEPSGYGRIAVQTISEDFSPLLNEPGGPLAFVLSPARDEWVALWTSLSPDAESQLAEAVASGLERPVVYAIFGGDTGGSLYRYFENGDLHEEILPADGAAEPLDEVTLLEKLRAHGVDVALIDDRTAGFGEEHLVVGYTKRTTHDIRPTTDHNGGRRTTPE